MKLRQTGFRVGVICGQTAVFLLLAVTGCSSNKQTSFASPDAAVGALATALRANDDAALKGMFGPSADELMASGDPIADRQRRERFLKAFEERHHLDTSEDQAILVIGQTDWPLPVPLVKDRDGQWYFDTDAGREEILNRRIGQNELDVMQVCRAIVDAQQEYARRDPEGAGVAHYARKFLSDPDKKNGLYWAAKSGEDPSPLGPMLADATEEGYSLAGAPFGEPQPYHGYYYRILESQGASAPGGAADYVVGGKLIGGFAVVAYPAAYGNSGIMTFMVNHAGELYQKDLGEDTPKIAKAMQSFDPGEGWQKTEEEPASAGGAAK